MKYVSLVLLAVILVSSLSLSSCRRAYLAGQESNSQSGAPDTQQQAPDTQSGSPAPPNPQAGSSNTQPGGATANQPPVARIISISPNEATQGDTVSFKGEGTDTDGTVKAYFWKSSIDGIISRVESFDFNMLSAGTHTISFLIVDNLGAKSELVTSGIVINTPTASHSGSSSSGADPNKPPEAHIISISPTEASEGKIVSFNGEGRDADGTVVAYNWKSSIDGSLSNKHSFDTNTLSDGDHIISFQVMDNDRAKSAEVNSRLVIHKLAQASPVVTPTGKITNAAIDWKEPDQIIFTWSVSDLNSGFEYWVYPRASFDGYPNVIGYVTAAEEAKRLEESYSWTISSCGLASYGRWVYDKHTGKLSNPNGTLALLAYDPINNKGYVVDISLPLDTSHW